MAKTSYLEIMLVNEQHPETGTKYMKFVPTKGTKNSTKLRFKKYDPVLRQHFWFVQKRLPSPK